MGYGNPAGGCRQGGDSRGKCHSLQPEWDLCSHRIDGDNPAGNARAPAADGWSLVSLNVNPADLGVAAVFGGTSGSASQNPSGQFLLVKDLQGDLYWPLYGINAIDTIHTGQGYMVYSDLPIRSLLRGVRSMSPLLPFHSAAAGI